MPSYLTSIVLEFSEDPISDASPAWQDVTSYMRNISWQVGIDREGSEPKPGSMTVVMKNTNRDWEPDYVAGRFYPNVTTQRRFRLTLNGTLQGLWYVQSFAVDYPAGTTYSEVTITCGDGCEMLALDDLALLDPPEAQSYSDVVDAAPPWGYWRLGEEEGTKARANIIRGIRRLVTPNYAAVRKFKVRRGTRYATRAEAGGVAGPSGVYVNNPSLGVDGLIVGDPDTAVSFERSQSQWARFVPEPGDLEGRKFSIEALVKPASVATSSNDRVISAGPVTAFGTNMWTLKHIENGASPDTFIFYVQDTAAGGAEVESSTTISAGTVYHLLGTWNADGNIRLYVNGVLEDENAARGLRMEAATGTTFGIAGRPGGTDFFDGVIDEVSVYEKELSAAVVLSHYEAARTNGYNRQIAGERIEEIVTNPLWSTSSVQVTGNDVSPMMQSGQARLDVISELAHSEGPRTLFYFEGDGDPVYLGHEFAATNANYNTVQWTFGDGPGEVSYQDIGIEYDNETFNDVTTSSQAGDVVNVTDATAIADKGRRANAEWTDVMLADQADVEALAADVLGFYKEPALRPVTLTINGSKALAQFQDLQLGHLIRIKRRGTGGTAIDRVVSILGKDVSVDENEQLLCTYRLSRGFNASLSQWHLGISGYSELGSTTVLA